MIWGTRKNEPSLCGALASASGRSSEEPGSSARTSLVVHATIMDNNDHPTSEVEIRGMIFLFFHLSTSMKPRAVAPVVGQQEYNDPKLVTDH